MKNADEKKLAATTRTNARRAELKDELVPLWGGEKERRVALGLALLQVLTVPGTRHSRDDIAAWCGCTPTTIYLIERAAIKKMRARLEAELGSQFYDLLSAVLDTSDRRPARSTWVTL